MRLTTWLFSVLLFITTASAADFTGTWKLNLAKSKPNDDLLAQTTKTEQIDSRTTRTTIDQEYKSGRMRHQEVIRIRDGQEHPSQGVAFPEGASEICEIVDGNTGDDAKDQGKNNDGSDLDNFSRRQSHDDDPNSGTGSVIGF